MTRIIVWVLMFFCFIGLSAESQEVPENYGDWYSRYSRMTNRAFELAKDYKGKKWDYVYLEFSPVAGPDTVHVVCIKFKKAPKHREGEPWAFMDYGVDWKNSEYFDVTFKDLWEETK